MRITATVAISNNIKKENELKTVLAIAISTLTIGCVETSQPTATAVSNKVPAPLIIVGAAGPGSVAANELRGDGLTVQASFKGRAAGLTSFCSGDAHAIALAAGQDLTSAERDRCRELLEGWGWSALTTEKGVGFYVRHDFVRDLLDTATKTF